MERRLTATGRPGWIIGIIDTPVYAYSNNLLLGESHASMGNPAFKGVMLSEFFRYIQFRGESSKLVSATPHTIARYARLVSEGGG